MARAEDIAADLEARAERLEATLELLRDEVIELRKAAHRIATAATPPPSRPSPSVVRMLRAAHE